MESFPKTPAVVSDLTGPVPPAPRLGLALGGGSVFGYAHVGVLETFVRAGLRPDFLTGTSAGAIAASLFAFGVPIETLRERFSTLTWRQITDLTRGRLGLFTNASLGELVNDLIGPARIEDAPIPLAILAADIETGEKIVLRDGPVDDAVRASASIPGLYAPVEIDGRRLVDGGILENVPVGPLRDTGADVVVGVSLMADVPFKRVRSLPQVLINAASFTLRETTRLDLMDRADVVIRPDLAGRAFWSFEDLPGLIESGRNSAKTALPDIEQALQRTAHRMSAPSYVFTQRLANRLEAYATDALDAGLPPLRTSAVQCDEGKLCAFIVTASTTAMYLVSVRPKGNHLLVRIESSTADVRLRVPLCNGELREVEQATGERAVFEEIKLDLQHIVSSPHE